jgi:hypothetical protein
MALKTRKKRIAASANSRPCTTLPRVEIKWTKREMESLAELASAREAKAPTDALIRAVRD